MRFHSLILLTITFASCLQIRKPKEIITAPSGQYNLEIDFNNNKDDKTKYQCIILTLLEKKYHQITTFQTGASDFQKWAIAWYPNKDTIIMNSGDIGTYAYHLTDRNQLDTITMTKEIDSIGEIIFKNKY